MSAVAACKHCGDRIVHLEWAHASGQLSYDVWVHDGPGTAPHDRCYADTRAEPEVTT